MVIMKSRLTLVSFIIVFKSSRQRPPLMLTWMGRAGTAGWTAPTALPGYLTAHLNAMSAFCCQGVLGWFPDPFWPRTLSQSLIFSSQIH